MVMAGDIIALFVRGTVVNRTYCTHKDLHTSLFLLFRFYLVILFLVLFSLSVIHLLSLSFLFSLYFWFFTRCHYLASFLCSLRCFVLFLLQVERLKGLQLKFTAFYKFLLERPHLADKIVLLQVGYTSGTPYIERSETTTYRCHTFGLAVKIILLQGMIHTSIIYLVYRRTIWYHYAK